MSLYTFSLNSALSHLIITTPTDVYALPYLGLSFGTPQGPAGDEQVTFQSSGTDIVSVRIMQSNLTGATWQLRIADLIANYLYMPIGSSTGSVTSINVSGGASGLTYTGGPITTAGTITLTSGPLIETYGGTHQTTFAKGDLLYASAANTLSKLPAAADGTVLTLASGVPSWATGGGGTGTVTSVDVSGGSSGLVYTGGPVTASGTITLASGQLAVGYGGTNSTTALNNNRVMVSNAGAIKEAAALTNGQLLIGSTGAAPVAASLTAGTGVTLTPGAGSLTIAAPGATGGTVTSVDVSGGTTGLTATGGPVTASGTITLGGTLVVANGGTGATSFSGNRVALTNAGGTALTTAAAMTDGQLLIGSTGAAPAVASLTAGTGITLTPGAGTLTIASTGGGGGVRSLLFLVARSSEHAFSLFIVFAAGACACYVVRTGHRWIICVHRYVHQHFRDQCHGHARKDVQRRHIRLQRRLAPKRSLPAVRGPRHRHGRKHRHPVGVHREFDRRHHADVPRRVHRCH